MKCDECFQPFVKRLAFKPTHFLVLSHWQSSSLLMSILKCDVQSWVKMCCSLPLFGHHTSLNEVPDEISDFCFPPMPHPLSFPTFTALKNSLNQNTKDLFDVYFFQHYWEYSASYYWYWVHPVLCFDHIYIFCLHCGEFCLRLRGTCTHTHPCVRACVNWVWRLWNFTKWIG